MSFRRWLVSRLLKKELNLSEKEWRHLRFSFSQYGEDLLVESLLPAKGFYIEVGAYDPVILSNTYNFYQLRGWRGILIEPNPILARRLRIRRPRDIVVEAALSAREGTADYQLSSQLRPGADSMNRLVVASKTGPKPMEVPKVIQVKTTTLRKVIEDYLPPKVRVDFLSIDVEGHDFEVLRYNNWNRCRPQIIAIEAHTPESEKRISDYLKKKGYTFVARLVLTLIYQKKRLRLWK